MDSIRDAIDWLKDLQFVAFLGLFLANSFLGDPFTKLLVRHLALRPRSWAERVEWPRGDWVLRQAGRDVFRYYPLAIDGDEELRQLGIWLAENAETNLTEEILLVARPALRNQISGVLYATLYKTRRTRTQGDEVGAIQKGEEPRAGCMVWYVLFRPGADHRRVGDLLWKGLVGVVEQEMFGTWPSQRPRIHVDYYVRGLKQNGQQEAAFTEFLGRVAGARRCEFPEGLKYLEPDTDEWVGEPTANDLYFTGDRAKSDLDGDFLSVGDVVDFVYSVAWAWAFEYGSDVLDLGDLQDVVAYLDEHLVKPTIGRRDEKVRLVDAAA